MIPGPELYLAASTLTQNLTAVIMIVLTQFGTADHVAMGAAQLDSVTAGPGAHRNATGLVATLETAIQLANTPTTNKLRFAWWGAEGSALIGSTNSGFKMCNGDETDCIGAAP